MKKKKKPKLGPLGIIIAVLLLGVGVLYIARNNHSYTSSQEQTKTYQSKSLKFSVIILTSALVKEKQTYVDIIFGDKLINVVRNGTNFQSLIEYLKDFDSKKKEEVGQENEFIINGYKANSRIENNRAANRIQKVYYIYVENWVYSLSTSSPTLYGDLDQIARSFRYAP